MIKTLYLFLTIKLGTAMQGVSLLSKVSNAFSLSIKANNVVEYLSLIESKALT